MGVKESEFTAPSPTCPHPDRWTAADENATENEVLEMIAGLVRGLQPGLAVEAGTYRGHGARAILRALDEGNHGRLITLDSAPPEDVHAFVTGDRAEFIEADATTWQPPLLGGHGPVGETPTEVRQEIDFAFIDAGPPAVRAAIFKNFYPHMPANSVVVIHDTGPHRGEMRMHITAWEQQALCKAVYLPTPRGVAILQITK